jgi:hypothetical protein
MPSTAKLVFHKDKTLPSGHAVFVFGSNLAGIHGAGAAAVARSRFGARLGEGIGRTGDAYAIPTKDNNLLVLPLDFILPEVSRFVAYATEHPLLRFFVTRIGCGLAGYRDQDIAPMFLGAPGNCDFPEQWRTFLSER